MIKGWPTEALRPPNKGERLTYKIISSERATSLVHILCRHPFVFQIPNDSQMVIMDQAVANLETPTGATSVSPSSRHHRTRFSPKWDFSNPLSPLLGGRRDYLWVEMRPVHQNGDEEVQALSTAESGTMTSLRAAVSSDPAWKYAIKSNDDEVENDPGAAAEISHIERTIELMETIYGSAVCSDGSLELQGDGLESEVSAIDGEDAWQFKMNTVRGAPLSGKSFVPDLDSQNLEILTSKREFNDGSSSLLEIGIGPKPDKTSDTREDIHSKMMKDPRWSSTVSKALKAQALSVSTDRLDSYDARQLTYKDDGLEVNITRASVSEEESLGIRYKANFRPDDSSRKKSKAL
ncbi:hypothetical protein I302_104031 [Kwoniella bestiolae CBS 10118]|uniref:Uncharacterized protein n=1 Tax=Kwoniella bestiolae CBS 10118 TaxID=1296100 RepID=A0A1B9GA42_9TREE|nr:hypothetical protein I302_02736 [Kwoniella bestiolae CBS 10118]OCF27886.1 hypothetical protein I302_02736 [Kwoniella bestiolae CBS 10118]